jgi:transposase
MAKASEWAERVDAWRASDLKASEFCKGRGYSSKNLLWWSSYFRRNGKPRSGGRRATRVPVARVIRTSVVAPTRAPSSPTIIVQVDRARVEVAAGVDAATLAAVFAALATGAQGGAR